MAARTNQIIISTELKGKLFWGYTNNTYVPGTCMKLVDAFFQSGLHSWRGFNGTAGDRIPIVVLLEDENRGVPLGATTTLPQGLNRFYCPIMGEELNMLKSNESGTGDDVSEGSILIVGGTSILGALLLTTGSPESEPFISLGTIVDPIADEHIPCLYTGY